MEFLVNEMGYDSLSIAETPKVLDNRLKERIIPRCIVIRILVSKGLTEEKTPLRSYSDKFVQLYLQEISELMKVFQGQLSYQELLLNEGLQEMNTRYRCGILVGKDG
ncbi:uncharacterized protein LOC113284167 [Papaver somniferum]|uniref:uncharacterized protein LOC113284167 n=1 Tax=Papaver somniferum TaxID=3469 RepID=UPI000E6F8BF1|nr:uncharacterized protein LOC113284167 [Papaver somniferum]